MSKSLPRTFTGGLFDPPFETVHLCYRSNGLLPDIPGKGAIGAAFCIETIKPSSTNLTAPVLRHSLDMTGDASSVAIARRASAFIGRSRRPVKTALAVRHTLNFRWIQRSLSTLNSKDEARFQETFDGDFAQ